MQVYESKAFLIHDNLPVVAKRVTLEAIGKTLEATGKRPSWRPCLTLFYGGSEAEDGSMGNPACTISINTYEQLEALKEAVEWTMLTYAVGQIQAASPEPI